MSARGVVFVDGRPSVGVFVPLAKARALVELYAEKGDRKFERAALKYLARYLAEANPSRSPTWPRSPRCSPSAT